MRNNNTSFRIRKIYKIYSYLPNGSDHVPLIKMPLSTRVRDNIANTKLTAMRARQRKSACVPCHIQIYTWNCMCNMTRSHSCVNLHVDMHVDMQIRTRMCHVRICMLTCLIHIGIRRHCQHTARRDACVPIKICMCDMTHSYLCVTWLIHMCDMWLHVCVFFFFVCASANQHVSVNLHW